MNFDEQTLLLVEDNEDDVFIFRRAYKQAQLKHPLQVVSDGQEAADYLAGNGAFSDRAKYPLPFLVLLDLKLPLKHGLEVLHGIRANPATINLCVIVLTSSAEDRDIRRAQELGAQAYLVKPPSNRVLLEVMSAVRALREGAAGSAVPKISGDMFDDDVLLARQTARSR
jgi:CheY-like chemotaxis protein